MDNRNKVSLLDYVYEYAIHQYMVLNKSLSINYINVLYEILNECKLHELSKQLQDKFNNYIFSNWDLLDRFKIKYNINNLYFTPELSFLKNIVI